MVKYYNLKKTVTLTKLKYFLLYVNVSGNSVTNKICFIFYIVKMFQVCLLRKMCIYKNYAQQKLIFMQSQKSKSLIQFNIFDFLHFSEASYFFFIEFDIFYLIILINLTTVTPSERKNVKIQVKIDAQSRLLRCNLNVIDVVKLKVHGRSMCGLCYG